MPNLIDSAQLQATAQVAKSYVLEQDTANVTTIINALQQGGGSGGTGKQVTTIGLADTIYVWNESQTPPPSISGTVFYNGDGTIYSSESDSTIENGSTLTFIPSGSRAPYILYAKETDNFSAAVFTY